MSLNLGLNDSLKIQLNYDNDGNVISKEMQPEQHTVINNKITLIQIPDEFYRVVINGLTELTDYETNLAVNNFRVDYNVGIVTLHPSKEAQVITVNKYYGRGIILTPATRIYTETNEAGSVIATVQDLIDDGKQAIENIGGISATIIQAQEMQAILEADLGVGEGLHDSLLADVTTATGLQTQLDTLLSNATTSGNNLNNSIADAITKKNNLDSSISDSIAKKTALDGSISSATTKKTQLDGSITSATTSKTNLDGSISTGNTLNTNLGTSITNANNSKTALDTSKTNADTSKTALDNSKTLADASKSALDTSKTNADASKVALDATNSTAISTNTSLGNNITTGNTLKANLDSNISTGNTLKTGLDSSISTGTTKKSDLDASIATATTKKSDLDTSNSTATTTKTQLDTSNTNASSTKTALDLSKTAGDNSKTALDASISTGNTLKTNLDSNISTGNTLKTNLDSSITTATTLEGTLNGTVNTANTSISELNQTNNNIKLWEAYNSAHAYNPLNKVTWNGSSYICISSCTNILPSNNSYWLLIAQRGVDGTGAVTGVSSVNADIDVANPTGAVQLTLNSGTGAYQIVKLDGNGKLPLAIIPDIAKQQTYVVADINARNALTGLISGDTCYITGGVGTGDSYIYNGSTWILMSDADWANVSLDWTNIIGRPASSVANIDDAVDKKHDHTNKVVLDNTTASFTTEEETRLNGISTGANKTTTSTTNGNIQVDGIEKTVYIHPENHSPSVIAQDANNRFVTDVEKTLWNTVGEKVDATEVLTLDNTNEYTPTDDYNPATKKFVLDNVGNSVELPMISKLLFVEDVAQSYAIDNSNGGTIAWTSPENAIGIADENVATVSHSSSTLPILEMQLTYNGNVYGEVFSYSFGDMPEDVLYTIDMAYATPNYSNPSVPFPEEFLQIPEGINLETIMSDTFGVKISIVFDGVRTESLVLKNFGIVVPSDSVDYSFGFYPSVGYSSNGSDYIIVLDYVIASMAYFAEVPNVGGGKLLVNGTELVVATPEGMGAMTALKEYTEFYVDADIGNDMTGDGSFGTPFKTLQTCIDAIPKYIYSYADILIRSSTPYTASDITISGFISGSLSIGNVDSSIVTINSLEIDSCFALIQIQNIEVNEVSIYNCANVILNVDSNASEYRGFDIEQSKVEFIGCNIRNKTYAIYANSLSLVNVQDCGGTDNITLFEAYGGSTIFTTGNIPEYITLLAPTDSGMLNPQNQTGGENATSLNLIIPIIEIGSRGYSGTVSTELIDSATTVWSGCVLYPSPTGYKQAKADSVSSMPCLALALEGGTGGNKLILKEGFYRFTGWTFTVGQLIYVDDNNYGYLTTSKPTTDTYQVQVIGKAVTTDTFYFSPSLTVIEN